MGSALLEGFSATQKAWRNKSATFLSIISTGETVTRKDFQMIADIIKLHRSSPTAKFLALDFVQAFKKVNPRFDNKRFLDACGFIN